LKNPGEGSQDGGPFEIGAALSNARREPNSEEKEGNGLADSEALMPGARSSPQQGRD